MRPSTHKAIRQLLRQSTDGLMVKEIAEKLGFNEDPVRVALHTMPDTYVDRWIHTGGRGTYSQVWCAVAVPENCPHPVQ